MIVGVISDSHDNIHALEKVVGKLVDERVELVVHLGDIISPFTVRYMREWLGNIPVIAVLGNNDGDKMLLLKLFNEYGWALYEGPSIIELGGRRFLIMHGYDGISHTEEIAESLLSLNGIDGVLYGHTHRRVYEKRGGKIILNPGEVCGYLTGKTSYAILDTGKLEATIHVL